MARAIEPRGGEATVTVGELARRSGLTVRTLHHYDQIGLLCPARRSASGYRLYAAADVLRLQRIRALQELGMTLSEVRAALEDSGTSSLAVLEQQARRLRERIERQRALCERLETLAQHQRDGRSWDLDQALGLLEAMARVDDYFDDHQRRLLSRRSSELGAEAIRDGEREWRLVFEGFERELRRGTPPDGPAARRLARRARRLIEAFTGGDAGLERSLQRLYQEQPPTPLLQGLGFGASPEVLAYMRRAGEALAPSERSSRSR